MSIVPKAVIEFAVSKDPESTLLKHLSDAVRHRATAAEGSAWKPGERLRLLLTGYFGAGNVGSDMRSGEIVRQLRHILGADNVELGALAVTSRLPQELFDGVEYRPFEAYIPDFLVDVVSQFHGVVACEGSMFTSTFSDALSAMMSSTLGLARRQGKVAVGYGAEIGAMTGRLSDFVASHTGDALILCRNDVSMANGEHIGLRVAPGSDTAWTFGASTEEAAGRLLAECGWNGHDPVLTLCPTNPYWWPIRPSPAMALQLRQSGSFADLSYGSFAQAPIFFHADSDEIRASYGRYIDQFAEAARKLCAHLGAFPVVIAMERVDTAACADLSQALGLQHSSLVGADHRAADVVALLRRSDLLVSSRFHALVGAMAGGVPSIGIGTDGRIANLFPQEERADRVVDMNHPDLAGQVHRLAVRLDMRAVAASSRNIVSKALVAQGTMGMAFAKEVRQAHPQLPMPERAPTWEEHLPPICDRIRRFIEH